MFMNILFVDFFIAIKIFHVLTYICSEEFFWRKVMIGEVVQGKYEVIAHLGSGGMADVYLVKEVRSHYQWAMKVFQKNGSTRDTTWLQQVSREVYMMKRLSHPLLPSIVDVIENVHAIYLVMDYIEGVTLDTYIQQHGPQSEKVVAEWGVMLGEVLVYLHTQNPPVVYRDIKPSNIMVQTNGRLRLIDSGIAREYHVGKRGDTVPLGTVGYAPSEQYGVSQTDPRSDIYAFGMTLHYALTGLDPTRAQYQYQSVRRIVPKVSHKMSRLIDTCTMPNEAQRYQTVQDMLLDLQKIGKRNRLMPSNKALFGGGAVLSAVVGSVFLYSSFSHQGGTVRDPLEQAIQQSPQNLAGYQRALHMYEQSLPFTYKQADTLERLFKERVTRLTDDERLHLIKETVLLYARYFQESDHTVNVSNVLWRVGEHLKSLSPQQIESDSWLSAFSKLSHFYDTHVVQKRATDKDVYDTVLAQLMSILESLEGVQEVERLVLGRFVSVFVKDHVQDMARVGVAQNVIVDMLEKLRANVESIRDVTFVVQRKQDKAILEQARVRVEKVYEKE